MSGKQTVTEHFDSYAPTWHLRIKQHPYAIRYRVVERMVAGLSPKTVVDVGSGTGEYCQLFDPQTYIGYDISPEMVKHSSRLYPTHKFEVGDAEQIPQPDASADLTLDIAVIEYYDDPLPHMRELVRITKPEGTVIVAVPNGDNRSKKPLNGLARLIDRLLVRPYKPYKKDILHNAHTLKDMRALGESVGLKMIDYGYCSLRVLMHDRPNTALSEVWSDRHSLDWLSSKTATILVCQYVKTV